MKFRILILGATEPQHELLTDNYGTATIAHIALSRSHPAVEVWNGDKLLLPAYAYQGAERRHAVGYDRRVFPSVYEEGRLRRRLRSDRRKS